MSIIIALAGKGGSGKTTCAALLVRLLSQQKKGSVLAIDADPNSNLGETLGVQVQETIGSILDSIATDPQSVPQGMSKDRYIEFKVQSAIAEAQGFDVLTMGKPEGPGCYCYVNNVLRNVVSKLIKDYEYVVIDNEAGLEHLSRRTTRAADLLLVVSDATVVGLRAAARISQLVKELKIEVKKQVLLVNRCDKPLDKEKLKGAGLECAGYLPYDKEVMELSLNGSSVMKLHNRAIALTGLHDLGEKLWAK